jgi:predicted site-specific integrase-resolvase
MPGETWLTVNEVAERLSYSAKTVRRYEAQGLFGPTLRTPSGRSLRISLEGVEAYERAHTSAGDGEVDA